MRAIDLTATQGKEPPQVKPGQYPGEYLELAVKDLVPVQKVRHAYKTIDANKKIKKGKYTPIVVDRNNRIVNGHHRYDALKNAGHHRAKVYKLEKDIEEII